MSNNDTSSSDGTDDRDSIGVDDRDELDLLRRTLLKGAGTAALTGIGTDSVLAADSDGPGESFTEDFSDGNFDEFVVVDGSRSDWNVEEKIDGNSLHVRADTSFVKADPATYSWSGDRDIAVDFVTDTGYFKKNGIIVFEDGDDQWFARVGVTGDGMNLAFDEGAEGWNQRDGNVQRTDVNIDDSAQHRLLVQIRDDTIKVSLDGTEQLNYTHEDTIGPGSVGFGIGGNLTHETWFDNFSVNRVATEACYDFEGSGSEVVDRTGNGYSGELVGATRVSGRGGKVINFNKNNQEYVRIGTEDTLDPRTGSYTASLWFKSNSVTNNKETLLSKRGNSNERFRIFLDDPGDNEGRIVFNLKDDPSLGNSGVRTSETYTDGEWHHVVAVRDTDQDQLELYVDGELKDTETDQENDVDPTGPLFLGGQPQYPNPRYYTGQIDDVKVWKAAVRPDETEAEPSDPRFTKRPPTAVEVDEEASFNISVDPGSLAESEIDAKAIYDITRWGEDVASNRNIPLEPGDSTEVDRIELEGQLPPAENESSSPRGLRYEITGIDVNGTDLELNNSPVTFAFENVEDTAVLFAKYSDSSGDLAPHRTGDELEKYQRKVEKEVNRYYASQPGSMGAVGFEMEFFDSEQKWFTVGPSSDYDFDVGEFQIELSEGSRPQKEFIEDAITKAREIANFERKDFDSIIAVSPGFSEDLTGGKTGITFNKKLVNISERNIENEDYISPIGAWSHELGHTLGAKDLYSNGDPPYGDLGVLDLMSLGGPVKTLTNKTGAPFSAVGRTQYNNLPWLNIDSNSDYSIYDIPPKSEQEYDDNVFEFKSQISEFPDESHYIVEFRDNERTYTVDVEDGDDFTIKRGVYIYGHSDDVTTFLPNPDQGLHDSEDVPDPTLNEEDSVIELGGGFTKFELENLSSSNINDKTKIKISEPTSEASNTTVSSVNISLPDIIPDDIDFAARPDLPTPDADLHAYDQDGNHIGPNYETGEFENEISGSYVSSDRPGGLEWIAVPDDINVNFKINTHDVEQWIQEAKLHDADIDTSTTYQLSLTQYGDDPNVEQIDGERTITDSTTIVSEEQTIAPGKESSAATTAMVDFDPDTLNLRGGGKWVTTYLTLPGEDVSVEDIELSSIELNGEVEAVTDDKYGFVQDPTEDVDDDGTIEFKAKFPRDEVADLLETGENVRVTISGSTTSGVQIIGSDRIDVIEPGR